MNRTRAALLTAARSLAATRGTKSVSMTDLAAAARVAKGTLYNHFRTKEEVWAALVEAEVAAIVVQCRELPLAEALATAARAVAQHPVVRRLADDEPEQLAALLLAPTDRPGWRLARTGLETVLTRSGADRRDADLLLRWLTSLLTAPEVGSDTDLDAEATHLAGLLSQPWTTQP